MQMQMDEEDELGWKALGVNVGMHGAGVGAGGMVGEVHDVVGAGVGVELGNGRSDIPVPDTDDEAFPKLDDDIAYDSRDASLRHSDASDGGVVRSASLRSASQNAQPKKPQRFKRKNFSKRLQLLCLQRYAEFAKENSNLPSKQECQFLLNQSYMEFVKEGGSTDEPRLTYQEFLKLIRNRRREMYVRASKQKFTEQDLQALTPAKRKLQLEHAKIQEYITIIDQTREQSNITHDKHRSSLLRQRTAINLSLQHQVTVPSDLGDLQSSSHAIPDTEAHEDSLDNSAIPMSADDQIEAIFQIQQETLEIQREIMQRLKVIRLHQQHMEHHLHHHHHNMSGQDEGIEPSSASV